MSGSIALMNSTQIGYLFKELIMKLFKKSHLAMAAVSLGSLLVASTASADYHVTAFGESTAYRSLLSKDAESAKEALGSKDLAKMDFIAANNLCVAQILAKELSLAIESCSLALEKVEKDMMLGMSAEKSAKASIYSNLAVARAMSGDMLGASSDLEKALEFNSSDRNASLNYNLISASMAMPAEIAGIQ